MCEKEARGGSEREERARVSPQAPKAVSLPPPLLLALALALAPLPPPSAQPLIKQYAPDSPSELAGWQQAVLLKLGFTSSELSATSVPVGQHLGEEAALGHALRHGKGNAGERRMRVHQGHT